MTQQHEGQAEPPGEAPLLREPPPPPGYVEPLAGSSAEDALPAPADNSAPDEVTPDAPADGGQSLDRAAR